MARAMMTLGVRAFGVRLASKQTMMDSAQSLAAIKQLLSIIMTRADQHHHLNHHKNVVPMI